jgi:hypothetical protein
LHSAIRRGKLFLISLISSNEKSVENIDASLKIISAKNFVHLSVGDAFDTEDQKTINPYSFFPLKHFN